jgi:hypothetical protein
MLGARDRGSEDSDGIISLVKETADGLGRLIGDHVKLARVELVADAKSYARGGGLLVGAAMILLLGYAMAWIAGALALARVIGAPLAFGAVALLHLVAGGVALAAAARRIRRTHLMDDTAAEVSRSVGALAAPFAGAARRS